MGNARPGPSRIRPPEDRFAWSTPGSSHQKANDAQTEPEQAHTHDQQPDPNRTLSHKLERLPGCHLITEDRYWEPGHDCDREAGLDRQFAAFARQRRLLDGFGPE